MGFGRYSQVKGLLVNNEGRLENVLKCRGWCSQVVSRGQDKDGSVHSVEHTYSRSDEETYGEFVSVVCERGDVRIGLTLAQIIHGSMGV